MVHVDEGHKLLERTLDLLSAACPLIKTGDKLDCQNWVSFTHKSNQDAVPSTSPMEYYGTWHIRMIIWTFRPCQTVHRPEMTSDTRHCCMCLPLPHQDRDSYHSGEESFANIRFGCSYVFTSFHFSLCHFDSFHIILCHFISFHVISYHFISFHIVSISLTLSDMMEPWEMILFDLCQARNVRIVPFAYICI